MATKTIKVVYQDKDGKELEGMMTLRKLTIGEIQEVQEWVRGGGQEIDMKLLRMSIHEAPFPKGDEVYLDPDSYLDALEVVMGWYNPFLERMQKSGSSGQNSSDAPTKQASPAVPTSKTISQGLNCSSTVSTLDKSTQWTPTTSGGSSP